MNTVSRVIRNTGFLYMKMGVTMFVSLYATRLVLNALGVDDFGIFNMVAGVIAMLAFLNASMAAATQRFMSYAEGEGDPEKQKIVFNISVVLHLAIAVMVGILLYPHPVRACSQYSGGPGFCRQVRLLGHDRQHRVRHSGRSL